MVISRCIKMIDITRTIIEIFDLVRVVVDGMSKSSVAAHHG